MMNIRIPKGWTMKGAETPPSVQEEQVDCLKPGEDELVMGGTVLKGRSMSIKGMEPKRFIQQRGYCGSRRHTKLSKWDVKDIREIAERLPKEMSVRRKAKEVLSGKYGIFPQVSIPTVEGVLKGDTWRGV